MRIDLSSQKVEVQPRQDRDLDNDSFLKEIIARSNAIKAENDGNFEEQAIPYPSAECEFIDIPDLMRKKEFADIKTFISNHGWWYDIHDMSTPFVRAIQDKTVRTEIQHIVCCPSCRCEVYNVHYLQLIEQAGNAASGGKPEIK